MSCTPESFRLSGVFVTIFMQEGKIIFLRSLSLMKYYFYQDTPDNTIKYVLRVVSSIFTEKRRKYEKSKKEREKRKA